MPVTLFPSHCSRHTIPVTPSPSHAGANLQDPAWAPLLNTLPNKGTILAASAAAAATAGPPGPRKHGQEPRKSGFRSGEEGTGGKSTCGCIPRHAHCTGCVLYTRLYAPTHTTLPVVDACRADPLNILWNGKPVPSCCKVHIVMQPTGVHRDLRPHLMYELKCEPCGSTVRITRPMHLDDWLTRHRSCRCVCNGCEYVCCRDVVALACPHTSTTHHATTSCNHTHLPHTSTAHIHRTHQLHSEEIRVMHYQDFSFCKPYLRVVHDAMEKLGILPSNTPTEAAARGPSRRGVGASRRKRTGNSPGESDGEGGRRPRDGSRGESDAELDAGPATRAALRQRRIKVWLLLVGDYAAAIGGIVQHHYHHDQKPRHLKDYAALVDDGESEGPSDPDSSDERPPTRPGGGRGGRPASRGARAGGKHEQLDDLGVSLLATVAMELDDQHDGKGGLPQGVANPAPAVAPNVADALATLLRNMGQHAPQMPAQLPPPLPPQPPQPLAALNNHPNPQFAQLAQQLLAQAQQQQHAQQQQEHVKAAAQLVVQMNMIRQQQQQQQQVANPLHALLAQLQQANRPAPAAPVPVAMPTMQQQLLQALTGGGGGLSLPGSMAPHAPVMMQPVQQFVPQAPQQQPSAMAQQLQVLAAMLQQQQQPGAGAIAAGNAQPPAQTSPQVSPPQAAPAAPVAVAVSAAAAPPPAAAPEQQQPQAGLQAANVQALIQRLLGARPQ